MPAQPLGVEARRIDLDGVRGEVVGSAGRDRLEPFRHAEPEGELLVVPRCAHGDCDRLTADTDLERLLDRDEVALARARGESERIDAAGRVRGRLAHAQRVSVLCGESRGPPRGEWEIRSRSRRRRTR